MEIAAQKQRDTDEMNRKLQVIQEQKERAEAQAAEERARLQAIAISEENEKREAAIAE